MRPGAAGRRGAGGAAATATSRQVASTPAAGPDAAVLSFGGYRLVPLRRVHCDDVGAFLGAARGAFACNGPESAWYAALGAPRTAAMAEPRKRTMWRQMRAGSPWISMSRDQGGAAMAATFVGPDGIVHLGTLGLRGRLGQAAQAAQLCLRLWRADVDYVMAYNFDQPQFAAAWAAARLRGRRLVVDYEDDHTLLPRAGWKNLLERRCWRAVDAAVCIHPAMRARFGRRPTCLAQSFADLAYLDAGENAPAATPLHEDMAIVFAGRLDGVRGARLLPLLVWALRRRLRRFVVHVAGDGPAAAWLRRLAMPEIRLHGQLEAAPLADLMATCAAALVLQPPDQPFARGSFPSKIETYAAARRPIWTLVAA